MLALVQPVWRGRSQSACSEEVRAFGSCRQSCHLLLNSETKELVNVRKHEDTTSHVRRAFYRSAAQNGSGRKRHEGPGSRGHAEEDWRRATKHLLCLLFSWWRCCDELPELPELPSVGMCKQTSHLLLFAQINVRLLITDSFGHKTPKNDHVYRHIPPLGN